jgi:pyruvate,orthophosphate dikinase
MQMVYGNKVGSGTSVFFTRNPFSGEKSIYGETRDRAAGEDLVRGKERNRPLAKGQTRLEPSLAGEAPGKDRGYETALGLDKSLEETDPELFALHRNLAGEIEDVMGGLPQEVEVTYETGEDGRRRIWVLQTRRMEVSAGAAVSFDEICRMESQIIGRGLAAHGGARSGVASFAKSPEEVLRLSRESGMPVILLRTTANTDDVSLMPVIGGIVTSSGGVTSHAAVLAGAFGVDAVVACTDMTIGADGQGEAVAHFGGTVVREGSTISIDGAKGLVFSGICLEPDRQG